MSRNFSKTATKKLRERRRCEDVAIAVHALDAIENVWHDNDCYVDREDFLDSLDAVIETLTDLRAQIA